MPWKFVYDLWFHEVFQTTIIALSQILSTLQIISLFVRYKPTKWIRDNQHCYNLYVYIYMCVCVCVCVCVRVKMCDKYNSVNR